MSFCQMTMPPPPLTTKYKICVILNVRKSKLKNFEVSQPLKNHHEQVDSMFLFNKMCIRPSPNMLMAPKSFC